MFAHFFGSHKKNRKSCEIMIFMIIITNIRKNHEKNWNLVYTYRSSKKKLQKVEKCGRSTTPAVHDGIKKALKRSQLDYVVDYIKKALKRSQLDYAVDYIKKQGRRWTWLRSRLYKNQWKSMKLRKKIRNYEKIWNFNSIFIL